MWVGVTCLEMFVKAEMDQMLVHQRVGDQDWEAAGESEWLETCLGTHKSAGKTAENLQEKGP